MKNFAACLSVLALGVASVGVAELRGSIELAEANARKMGVDNVAFHLAEIESLPLVDDTVDCVISNCVLNLVPDKLTAFREIHRILKPGGRLAVSDIALKRPLPPELAESVAAYTGCIAGAPQVSSGAPGASRSARSRSTTRARHSSARSMSSRSSARPPSGFCR